MKNFFKDGKWPGTPRAAPEFVDLTELPDLMDAQNTVARATEAFNALDSGLRKKFHNDPQEYIDFLSDPKNDEEAIQHGMKVKRPPEKPDYLKEISEELKSQRPKPAKKPQEE